MKYNVTLSQHRYYTTTLVVEAEDEEEAMDEALGLLEDEEVPWVEDSRGPVECLESRPLKPTA